MYEAEYSANVLWEHFYVFTSSLTVERVWQNFIRSKKL